MTLPISLQRLDQFIAKAAGISRRDAKNALKQGRISLNGETVKSSSLKVSDTDRIHLNQNLLSAFQHKYYALHKPANYCCSHIDDGAPSVLRLLPCYSQKLLFAGRLDADTSGLLLISSDGQWCHRVSHPKSASQDNYGKTYQVTLAEALLPGDTLLLCRGIMLKNESKPTLPCQIDMLDHTQLHITLFEGRYHQVKRMFAAIGNKVTCLHRLSVHGVELGDLPAGQFRELSQQEVNMFSPTNAMSN